MNALCLLLKPENILLGISPSSKKRVFEQAAQALSLIYRLDRKEVFDALIAREKLGSTYLGHGISLPHCRLPNLSQPCALFIRLHGQLDPARAGEEPTHSLFFLLAPEEACSEHLELLAGAAEIFSDESIRTKLSQANTSEKFCEALNKWCAEKYESGKRES